MKSVQGMTRQEVASAGDVRKCSLVSCYHVTGALRRPESVSAVRMIARLQNQVRNLHKRKRVRESTKFLGAAPGSKN